MDNRAGHLPFLGVPDSCHVVVVGRESPGSHSLTVSGKFESESWSIIGPYGQQRLIVCSRNCVARKYQGNRPYKQHSKCSEIAHFYGPARKAELKLPTVGNARGRPSFANLHRGA